MKRMLIKKMKKVHTLETAKRKMDKIWWLIRCEGKIGMTYKLQGMGTG